MNFMNENNNNIELYWFWWRRKLQITVKNNKIIKMILQTLHTDMFTLIKL